MRPLNAAIAGADGATLTLSNYTAFNLPLTITKTGGNTPGASANFYYDAGYQRVRQVKFNQSGTQADDILYVVPGGFEVHRDASGKIISSIATVSGPDGVIATVSTNFDPVTGQAITQTNATSVSGSNSVTKLLLKDHLGSMVAEFVITAGNAGNTAATNGTISVHGFGPWGNARAGLNGDQRGFTGHEHLAELGIIHMNGRLYDAVIGRFLQADPIIQAPQNAQSHNRYSYVLNNPLSFTDPSGFSWWTKWRGTVLSIAAMALMQFYLAPMIAANVSFALLDAGVAVGSEYAIGTAVGAAASGFAVGGIAGGNIQSALQGAFFAGATSMLASGFGLHGSAMEKAGVNMGKLGGQIALHAAMGCAQSAAAGGSCRSGAIAGGVSAFASPWVPASGVGKLVAQSAIGAVASKLSGGKAENGALTAAFSYLFNESGSQKMRGYWRELPESGGGYETYGTPANGQWGDARVIGTLENVAQRWAIFRPDASDIYIGNISLEDGGKYPGHSSHKYGFDADIRPIRSDGEDGPVTFRSKVYDQRATQDLVDLLHCTAGVSKILFNDPQIKGVTPFPGHDNHLHVIFKF